MASLKMARLPPIGSKKAQELSPRRQIRYEGLTGPNYSLGETSNRYSLPPPRVLRPYTDTSAGGLDTWPAHATGPHTGGALALTSNKRLIVIGDDKHASIPKPKFLEQLESFLDKELQALGVETVGPNELRLQAFREVFEYLIEDFKTYKPILASIKHEYEMMLSHQRDEIRQLQPLRQMLVTVSEQCDQKIMDLRETEKQEMVDLKAENRSLYREIDALKQEQESLEIQVERLKDELAKEYKNFRDEADARKLLISDMNDLRNQQEDTLMTQQAMADHGEKDDPMTLKIALRRARMDEKEATRKLHEMEANYGDVIPRREFEALDKKHGVLNEQMEEKDKDFLQLQSEHETLLAESKLILQQRDDYYIQLTRLKENTTPRPDWERCGEYISGGVMRWNELSETKTSNEKVQVLLNEIIGAGTGDGAGDYFEPRGTGPEVPKYLRYEVKEANRVRNRRLGRRDTALLVKDILREKAVHDAELTSGKRDKLADFLHLYLQRRFGLEKMILEWGYNLHDSCERFSHDELIGSFWKILNNELDEEVYHQQQLQLHKLLTHLMKVDMDVGNPGNLDKQQFKDALLGFFGAKDEESVQMMCNAAETDLDVKESDRIDYKALFLEDDEGHVGPFLEEVKNQLKNEAFGMVEQIKQQLGTTSPVTPDELSRALSMGCSHVKAEQAQRIVCYIFSVDDSSQLPEVEALDQTLIVQKLGSAYIPANRPM